MVGKRILAVEDSATQAEVLRYQLESEGYEVELASNGVQALAAVDRFRPDAVVSDILMPEMDGYQLCRELKASERWRDVPVVLVTSLSDPVEVVEALASGAEGFLGKPHSQETLARRLRQVLTEEAKLAQTPPAGAMRFEYEGRDFSIAASRRQVVNFLLSTYETAVERNELLGDARDELHRLNESLEAKVRERTRALDEEVAERRRAEARLRELNEALERRARQLRHLAMELTRTEQAERRRLAQMLHDHLQQLLVGAKMLLNVEKDRPDAADRREPLARVEELLGQVIEVSRSLTVELYPPVLRDGGLVAGLRWLGHRMAEQYGFQARLHVQGELEHTDDETAAFLFQGARELLFNAFKHSGVREADVELAPEGDCLRLVVHDAGRGFDLAVQEHEGAAESDSFGLFSLNERTEGMGGRMTIESRPGEGTRIALTIPQSSERARAEALGERGQV